MKGKAVRHLGMALCCIAAAAGVQGCASSNNNGKTKIEIVQYKPEAASYFAMVE